MEHVEEKLHKDRPTTNVRLEISRPLFLLRSFVRGSDGYTPQVLEHRSEWDARAGVGVHRRDRECRTRIGGEELSDEKKTKKN